MGRFHPFQQGQALLDQLEYRFGLTRLGLALLASGVAAAGLGRALGNPGLGLVGLILVVLVVGTWLFAARRIDVVATRDGLPSRVRSGRVIDGGFELTSRRTLTSLTALEHFPAGIGHDVRVPVAKLSPGVPSVHAYRFAAVNRGVYHVGPLVVEAGDAFGIVRRHHVVADPTTLVVHPRVDRVLDRIVARRWEDPVLRPPRSVPWPTGSELYGMHEYQPGDDPRRIVWSALARFDTYYVREAEQGITDLVTILLDDDVRRYDDAVVCESFEAAVRVAASVACSHLDDGFSVAIEGNTGTVFARTRGRHHRMRLLDALAAVQREHATLRTCLERLMCDRGGDGHHVVITSHIDTATAYALQVFASRGRSLVVVLVANALTDAATWRHASALRCPVVEVDGDEPLHTPFLHAIGLGGR